MWHIKLRSHARALKGISTARFGDEQEDVANMTHFEVDTTIDSPPAHPTTYLPLLWQP